MFIDNIIYFFSKLIIFIACSIKDLQIFFMQYLSLYIVCLFSTPSNVHIVSIEYTQGICSPTFLAYDFTNLFYIFHLHPPLLLIKDSKSGKIIHGTLSNFWYWLNCNILMSSIFTNCLDEIQVCVFFKMNEDNSNNKNCKQFLGFFT